VILLPHLTNAGITVAYHHAWLQSVCVCVCVCVYSHQFLTDTSQRDVGQEPETRFLVQIVSALRFPSHSRLLKGDLVGYRVQDCDSRI
jgi:hypothetical protein